MPPNITSSPTENFEMSGLIGALSVTNNSRKDETSPQKFKAEIVWRNVILFAYLHLAALYGVLLMLFSAKALTGIWALFLYQAGILGVTAGAHRLWSHRSYKAKFPLRVLLIILNTMAFQNPVHDWVRDHRVHHKFSDTDADPHNVNRGLFFSHMGWLLVRKHPDVKEKGKSIDMTDLDTDPVLMFQKKYYLLFMPILCFMMPTLIPVYFWNETWSNAWFVATLLRYATTLNTAWLVNSVTHNTWGTRPYDKSINPADNAYVSAFALGEGWHNYHHVFPWDYKTAELGNYRVNLTTTFLNFFASIGWAYDLKTVPMSMVKSRVERTGDGTHAVWGWGDKDMTVEDMNKVILINK